MYKIGIDIGSTTAKAVLTDNNNTIVYSNYLRHNADVQKTLLEILKQIQEKIGADIEIEIIVTGSAGM